MFALLSFEWRYQLAEFQFSIISIIAGGGGSFRDKCTFCSSLNRAICAADDQRAPFEADAPDINAR